MSVNGKSLLPPPVRKSRRLSGALPDLSLAEASKAIESPRTPAKARGRRGQSEELEEVLPTVCLPAKKRPIVASDLQPVIEEVVREKITKVLEEPTKVEVEKAPSSISSARPEKAAQAQAVVVRGRCKSGRFWKSERDRFRSIIKSKGLKQSYEKRQRQKEEMRRAKDFEVALKEERKQKVEDLKKRREENKKRREENEKKSEIVQVIKNPAKIKRMKKKQLRKLAKRDTTVVQKA